MCSPHRREHVEELKQALDDYQLLLFRSGGESPESARWR